MASQRIEYGVGDKFGIALAAARGVEQVQNCSHPRGDQLIGRSLVAEEAAGEVIGQDPGHRRQGRDRRIRLHQLSHRCPDLGTDVPRRGTDGAAQAGCESGVRQRFLDAGIGEEIADLQSEIGVHRCQVVSALAADEIPRNVSVELRLDHRGQKRTRVEDRCATKKREECVGSDDTREVRPGRRICPREVRRRGRHVRSVVLQVHEEVVDSRRNPGIIEEIGQSGGHVPGSGRIVEEHRGQRVDDGVVQAVLALIAYVGERRYVLVDRRSLVVVLADAIDDRPGEIAQGGDVDVGDVNVEDPEDFHQQAVGDENLQRGALDHPAVVVELPAPVRGAADVAREGYVGSKRQGDQTLAAGEHSGTAAGAAGTAGRTSATSSGVTAIAEQQPGASARAAVAAGRRTGAAVAAVAAVTDDQPATTAVTAGAPDAAEGAAGTTGTAGASRTL